jgi:hypothetical protein
MGDGSKDKARLKKEPRPCPSCGMIKTAQICGNCGFKTEPRSDISSEEGKLVELKTAMAKRNRADSWDTKIAFMGGLKQYAMNKSYKEGWASNAYRDHYAVWPNDLRVKNASPIPINDAVQGYITHKNIAYARGKRA